MTRECHVRFWEHLGGKFPGVTRQSGCDEFFPDPSAVKAEGGGIGWDFARSRQWVAPAERVEAAEALALLNQRVPHDLQPQRCSGLSRRALPAKQPGRLIR